MLDGIPLPTEDISGISQYNLQRVEVFKSVTADMEGDAVAGAINLHLNEAPSGYKGSLLAEGGYNNLNDYFKNYKFVASVSNRFFDDELGLVLNLDAENTNRSTQTLSASYQILTVPSPGRFAPLFATGINLNDIRRYNQKEAATLVLDYKPSSVTKFLFTNFLSFTDQNYTDVTKSYGANNGTINYSMDQAPNINSLLYVSNLKVQHEFESFELEEGVSFSQSHAYTPLDRNWSFGYNGIGLQNFGTQAAESEPLNQILAGATDALSAQTLSKFYMESIGDNETSTVESNIDAHVNAKTLFQFGQSTSGYLKLGGEYKVTSHNQTEWSESEPVGGLSVWGNYAAPAFPWAQEYGVTSITAQGLNNGSVSNFLKGQLSKFRMVSGFLEINRSNRLVDCFLKLLRVHKSCSYSPTIYQWRHRVLTSLVINAAEPGKNQSILLRRLRDG